MMIMLFYDHFFLSLFPFKLFRFFLYEYVYYSLIPCIIILLYSELCMNIAELEFVALDITGKNDLSYVLDADIHLDVKCLGETIKERNKTTCQDKDKTMIFLHHYLHEGVQTEYLTIKDPQILWINLKERYDHQEI